MDFITNVIKTMPLVASVLKTDFKSRDDDNVLLLAIWDSQTNGELKSYEDFKHLLLNGDLSIPSTIVRVRRKLQSKYPELRGEKYYERQKMDREIRNQIKMNFDIE